MAALQSSADGHLSVGADGSLTLRGVVERDAGDYSCQADNGVGSPLRRSVRLTVTGQWPVVSGQWSVVSGQWSVVSCQWAVVRSRG